MIDTVINVEQILGILRKRIKIIVIFTLLGGLIAGLGTHFLITPKYIASSEVLVNRKYSDDANAQLNQAQADIQMISTYKDIITNPIILNDVATNLHKKNDFHGSAGELGSMINVSSKRDSQVFSVNVTSANPYLASDIANETVTVFRHKINKIMRVNNVTIISRATPNTNPVSPAIKENIGVGLIIGVILGVLLAFLREYFDKTVKDTAFITDTLKLPNLGIVFEIPDTVKSYKPEASIPTDHKAGSKDKRVKE
ncbi:YveK family protein [Agrilactobacillus fermenti]|uniref:YveK family protein n=1 Tax=Agrilactobacillus fermenti TaxID=2586909 RepID=UPI001E45E9A4|nr:Wzz/FepE/Etk N-terminal domain-containing protein [Agrilactobacillus fermenti]MCD2255871.1 chain-length determining protein [Agrilactobacillus fermenti]